MIAGIIGYLYVPNKDHELWIFITASATVFLWLVAFAELGGVNKTTKADFVKRFTDGFFNETTRDILILLDYNALSFRNSSIDYGEDVDPKPFPYFFIDEEIVKQLKMDPQKQKTIMDKKFYSGYEIDDYILGPMESIAYFEKGQLLNIEQVYNEFDFYIGLLHDNSAIQEYIKQQRDNEKDGSNIFDGLTYIREKCDSYEKNVIKNNKSLLIWEIKWWLSEHLLKN